MSHELMSRLNDQEEYTVLLNVVELNGNIHHDAHFILHLIEKVKLLNLHISVGSK